MDQKIYRQRKSRVLERYSLVLIDLLSILISFVIAFQLRFLGASDLNTEDIPKYQLMCVLIMFFSILYSSFVEWNVGFFERSWKQELAAVIKYTVFLVVGESVLLVMTKDAFNFSRMIFLYFFFWNIGLNFVTRMIFKTKMVRRVQKNPDAGDRVMVVTKAAYAQRVIDNVIKNKTWHYSISSMAVMDEDQTGRRYSDIPVIATGNNLYDIAREQPLDVVFIYMPDTDSSKIGEMIQEFEKMGITCNYSIDIPGIDMRNEVASNFAGYGVVTFSKKYMDYRLLMVKRMIDIVGSLVGLLITGIITPFVAIAIKAESPGPVFFAQTRIGKNGRRFKIYKFRSMYTDAEERKKDLEAQNEVKGLMFKMDNDPRITKVGRFIRKFSIDELPQFYNVLIGDMSLVGTRPPTCDEFSQYNNYYRRRLCITPGLTGMWQVSGRSDIDNFDDVVQLDLKYIDQWSLGLDLKILFATIGAVFAAKGSR